MVAVITRNKTYATKPVSRRHVRWDFLRSLCSHSCQQLTSSDSNSPRAWSGVFHLIPKPQLDSVPASPTHHHLWSLPQMQTTPFSLTLILSLSSLLTILFSIRCPRKCCDLPNHLSTGDLPPPWADTGFSTDGTAPHPTVLPREICSLSNTQIHQGQEMGQHFIPSIISLPSDKTPAILRCMPPTTPCNSPHHS